MMLGNRERTSRVPCVVCMGGWKIDGCLKGGGIVDTHGITCGKGVDGKRVAFDVRVILSDVFFLIHCAACDCA